jgi:hypothetical protein
MLFLNPINIECPSLRSLKVRTGSVDPQLRRTEYNLEQLVQQALPTLHSLQSDLPNLARLSSAPSLTTLEIDVRQAKTSFTERCEPFALPNLRKGVLRVRARDAHISPWLKTFVRAERLRELRSRTP